MSFDPTLPTQKDKVRLEVGDTDPDHELLDDAQYNAILLEENNVKMAASRAARLIAAKLARDTDYSFSTLGQSASQAFDHYMQLADKLEQEAGQSISAGPLFVSSGDDPPDPIFDVGMHDND